MKRWSRWLSKDEVQQWNTCPEPIELLLIGCSTESIWNPGSKSHMVTAKPNSLTYWQREFFVWRVESFSPFVQHEVSRVSRQETTSSEDRCRSQNQWFQRRRDQSTWFLRRPRSAMENLPQDLWYPVYPENVDEGQGDHTGIGRASIKETCAEMDRETVVSSLFESVSKVKEWRETLSWIGRERRKTGSAKILRSWGRRGGQTFGKEKFRYCSLWDSIRSLNPQRLQL